jgi:hypothetical protein
MAAPEAQSTGLGLSTFFPLEAGTDLAGHVLPIDLSPSSSRAFLQGR